MKKITVLFLMISYGISHDVIKDHKENFNKDKFKNIESKNNIDEIIDDINNQKNISQDDQQGNDNNINQDNDEYNNQYNNEIIGNIKKDKTPKTLSWLFRGIGLSIGGIIIYLVYNISTSDKNTTSDKNKEVKITPKMFDIPVITDEKNRKQYNDEINQLNFKIKFSENLVEYINKKNKKISLDNNILPHNIYEVQINKSSKIFFNFSFKVFHVLKFISIHNNSNMQVLPLIMDNKIQELDLKQYFNNHISLDSGDSKETYHLDNKIFDYKTFKSKLEEIILEDMKTTLQNNLLNKEDINILDICFNFDKGKLVNSIKN